MLNMLKRLSLATSAIAAREQTFFVDEVAFGRVYFSETNFPFKVGGEGLIYIPEKTTVRSTSR